MNSYEQEEMKVTWPISPYNLFHGTLTTVSGTFLLIVFWGIMSNSTEPDRPVAVLAFLGFLMAFIVVYGLHLLYQRVQVDKTGITIRRLLGTITIPYDDIHAIEIDEWVYQIRQYAPAIRTVDGRKIRVTPRTTINKQKGERSRRELENAADAFGAASVEPSAKYNFNSNPYF